MEILSLMLHVESLVFASDKPLTVEELADLVNNAFALAEEDKVDAAQITIAIQNIIEKYSAEVYPFEVRESGGGWQFLTKKEYYKTVAQLNGEKFLKKLSAAALETLAIIAYKQPITKGEIETIRGVSSDYTVQKLLEKELIIITGRAEHLPGHPLVYATSKTFMDYFGINSPEELPKIKEIVAGHIIEPTIVKRTDLDNSQSLAVSDAGELIANQTSHFTEPEAVNAVEENREPEAGEASEADANTKTEVNKEVAAEPSEQVSDTENNQVSETGNTLNTEETDTNTSQPPLNPEASAPENTPED